MAVHHADHFFFSSHRFARVGSGWSCLTGELPGMCHLYIGGSGCAGKQCQSPSHRSLGAGWDTAGGWGEGGFGQHLTGKRFTTVRRFWLPGSSGHQLRWLARQVCSVVFGGVRRLIRARWEPYNLCDENISEIERRPSRKVVCIMVGALNGSTVLKGTFETTVSFFFWWTKRVGHFYPGGAGIESGR